MKQKEYMEYRPLGEEIERIRKGKNIPLRVFDENGVSSRSYQRFVQGNSELRISDLAIIVEILSISPMEMTEKLTPMSKTVLAKEQFNQAIFSKIFKKVVESLQIIGRIMINRLCFRKARSNVFDVGVGISFNPQTVVTKEEIIALENQILERLINADVYTIFNLKFLALQKCWLDRFQLRYFFVYYNLSMSGKLLIFAR